MKHPLIRTQPPLEEMTVNIALQRREENALGKYYTTHDCDGCGTCFLYAVKNFMYSYDSTYYFVFRQPATEAEHREMRRAISLCPMHCIRDDGDTAQ
jgi:ferredoxin